MAQARIKESFEEKLFQRACDAFSKGLYGDSYKNGFTGYWARISGQRFKLENQFISNLAAAYNKKVGTEKQTMLRAIGHLYKLAIIVDFLNLHETARDAIPNNNEIIADIKFTYKIINISELEKEILAAVRSQKDPWKHGLWKNLESLAAELINAYKTNEAILSQISTTEISISNNKKLNQIPDYIKLSKEQNYLNDTAPPVIIKRARSNLALGLGIVSLLCAGAGTTAFLAASKVLTYGLLVALSGPAGWVVGGVLAFAALCFAGACYYKHTANSRPKNQSKTPQKTENEIASTATPDAIKNLIIQKCNKQNIPVTTSQDSKNSSSLVKFELKGIECRWSSNNPYDFFYGNKKQKVGSVLKKLENPEPHNRCVIL